jgi:phosphatidylglycerophosphate synthase
MATAEQSKTEKVPAIIFAGREAGLKIAALTVLDRLVVAIHRAGAGSITIVTENPLPELKRAKAWKIPFTVSKVIPQVSGRVLLAEANLLVQPVDVQRCLDGTGRLVGKEQGGIQELLQLGVVAVEGRSVLQGKAGARASEFPVEMMFSASDRPVQASGIARSVEEASIKEVERALWATMWSSSDGLIDRVFNRPVGRFLSKVLIHTPVSPNMVSIASILIGVIAAVFLAEGSYRWALIGAILFQLSAIVDCVDGDLARMMFKESPLGKWIDLAGDQIVHISVFAGIAFGVLRNGGGKETVWLGISAIVGALISFVVVLRGMRQAAAGNSPLQKLIDAATNRDFSVIVLFLALAQKLPLFLWMAGIGSHLFWITALGLQLAHKPAASK